MTELARPFTLRKPAETPTQQERRALSDGLRQTVARLNQAYVDFDLAQDPDLIECAVFEIKALQARYSYYLRQVKRLEAQLEGEP